LAGQRRIDIARDQYLDWILPDSDRFTSGKHCEVRAENGEYLLYDVSNNSALVNGSEHRVQSPDRLRTGDRLTIGQCIIAVSIDDEGAAQQAPPGMKHRPASYDRLWDAKGESPPPITK
jgi:type VI secretion system protein ImpI